MKSRFMFRLRKDKTTQTKQHYPRFNTVYVEAGSYPIIRWFDRDRVLIDTGGERRQLTIMETKKGQIHK